MVVATVNTFDAVPAGDTITSANSGGGNGDAFNVVSSGSGSTLIADATDSAHGGQSLKIATGVTAFSPFVAWTSARLGKLVTSRVRAYLKIAGNPAANHRIISMIGAGVGRGGVLLTTTGKLRTIDASGSTIQNTATSVPAGQWVRVEAEITGHATAGQMILKLFTSPESTTPAETITSSTAENTGGYVDTWRFGLSASQANVAAFHMDSIAVDPDGWPGPFNPFSQVVIDTLALVDTGSTEPGIPDRAAVFDGMRTFVEIPVGDQANRLDADGAGFETSTGGWTAVTNCSLARSTAQAYLGAASLAMTATATGETKAQSATVGITGGQPYRGQVAIRATATGRVAYVILAWYQGSTPLSSTAGPSTSLISGTWVSAMVSATAPANADGARLLVNLFTPAASEVAYIDDARILPGTGSPYSIATTGALTVVALMRPDALVMASQEGSGYVHWLGKGATGEHEWTFRMYSLGNSENRQNRISCYGFNLYGSLGNGSYFQDPLVPGEWIMVGGAWDATSVAIYRDGVLRDTDLLNQSATGGPVITAAHGAAPVRIGTRDMNSYFQGAIGRVSIFNRRLTDQEMAALQTARLAGTLDARINATSGLVGFWKLNDRDATTGAVDNA